MNTEIIKKETIRKSPRQGLNIVRVLEAHRGERHIIVLHDFPDPDAISSGYAHKLISIEFGIDTDIVYCGKISHQENVALIRLLGIEVIHFDEALDLTAYQGAVFIDNQGTTCPEIIAALNQAGIPILIVVDHHEQQDQLKPDFSDIRRTGSTATIYSEYLENGLLKMDKSRDEHMILATALMHGLKSDTKDFLRASVDDFCAASFLSQFSDPDLFLQILSQERSKQTMEIIRQALEHRAIVENFSLAGVGFLRPEDRDAIPQAADILLTEENVHTAIVYGILAGNGFDEKLVGSLRTSKLMLEPDKFLKEVFGKDTSGRYFGGGKDLAGGFEIPVGFLAGTAAEEKKLLKWQLFDSQVKQKIFDRIGIEDELIKGR
jgi:nanoRNase/pAp phosphatase (c-di-AMP/oligoRNAs hydrolase)